MRKFVIAMACAMALSSCSKGSADTLPPLEEIQKATLNYANCVDQTARKLAAQAAEVERLAKRAVGHCRELRAEALKLKGVPVMFPSIAEFDATHLGLAQNTIQSVRGKNH